MSKPAKTCRKCGEPMEWEDGDFGEPPTWSNPMGGCPPTLAGWACSCGEFEQDDDTDDDYEPIELE